MNDMELQMEYKKLRDAGCGWKNGVYHKGTPEQEKRKRELSCIEMINSILAYNCRGYSVAKDVLEHEKKNFYHNYLEPYITELGEDRVLELIQGQIDSIDTVEVGVSRDSEGVYYNSIKWKEEDIEQYKIIEETQEERYNQTMKHYVVVLDSAYDYESFIHILAVKHTYEEAKKVFDENIEEEKEYAKRNGFTIFETDDALFDAGKNGEWSSAHTKLYIEEVGE